MIHLLTLPILLFDAKPDDGQPYIVNSPIICIVSRDFRKDNIYASITLDNGIYNFKLRTYDDEVDIDERFTSVEELLFRYRYEIKENILDYCDPVILEPSERFLPQILIADFKSSPESIKDIDRLMGLISVGDWKEREECSFELDKYSVDLICYRKTHKELSPEQKCRIDIILYKNSLPEDRVAFLQKDEFYLKMASQSKNNEFSKMAKETLSKLQKIKKVEEVERIKGDSVK